MKYLLCLVAICSLYSCSKQGGSAPNPGSSNIKVNFLANSTVNQGGTLQQEIDSCSAIGGGTVEVATPGVYYIGPILMRSNVTLQIDSLDTLRAMPYLQYPNYSSAPSNLITGTNLTNIAITGKGVIDGNGAAWWSAYSSNGSISRPDLVYFTSCTNVTLTDITLMNSPQFHFVPKECNGVTVTNVKILAPSNSPNTDGIDPNNSKNITITGCYISNGDDCIAIKAEDISGVTSSGESSSNITVSNCTFGTGHGLSIGSNTNDGVSNVTVTNCTFNGTTNGLRIKSNIGLGGPVTNISYTNITMTNVEYPIYFYNDYTSNGGGTGIDTPMINGVTITNMTSTNTSTNSECGRIYGNIAGLGNVNKYLQNVTLNNVNISAQTGLQILDAEGINLNNCVITAASGDSIIATNVLNYTGFP